MTDTHHHRPLAAPAGPAVSSAVWSAVMLLAITTMATVAYTLALALVAAAMFPAPRDTLVLSPGLAERFAGPRWFHGRPTAAAGVVSGGSNLGPTNPALAATIADRVAQVRRENPAFTGPVPVDLVTASGSGFDPHISPAAARLQVARVAAATGIAESVLRDAVERIIEPPTLGMLGHARVNVITLNQAVEAIAARRPTDDATRR